MNIETSISRKFNEESSQYRRLGINIQQALETFLNDLDIPYLSISYRIKALDSLTEKIDRKGYKNTFDQIEDICGLRIICYYQSDIHKIQQIIESEFNIIENKNKQEQLEVNEFGYRSFHFIATVKQEWAKAPNYRNLEKLKFEIQVRTILMHAWAEISHKLSYKAKTHIPKELHRKFSRISAQLEEADQQFEEIKNSIYQLRHELIANANKHSQFNYTTELNLDSLQAFLDYSFGNREKDIEQTRELLDEMQEFSISFEDVVKGYERHKSDISTIEKEEISRYSEIDKMIGDGVLWAQAGAARTLFELINDKYFESRIDNPESIIVKKFR